MKDITFEIKKQIAVLSENENGYSKQINVVSWNEGKPQLDIRMWKVQQDGTQRPLKGIPLTADETKALQEAIKGLEMAF